jgi:hypothetical protein
MEAIIRVGLDRNQAKGIAMAIDLHYIPAFSIEDVLLDKDTGAPMSGGKVYFYRDSQRGTLKPVYQITGSSPNYTFTQLPNPMILSSIGTFEDSLGNPTVPYFFPYDGAFETDLYFVRVRNADDVPQFDRQAVPYVLPLSGGGGSGGGIENQISNPQFAEVLFDTSLSEYPITIGTVTDQVIAIAPDWDLVVSCATTGSVTVKQVRPLGSENDLTNPGTLLNIKSSGLSKLWLRQRLYGSPNLWGSGNIAVSFVGKTYSGTGVGVTLNYSQSNGAAQSIVLKSATLPSSGSLTAFPGSATIIPSTSSENYPDAYVDIYFDLPLGIEIDITSVILISTGAAVIDDLVYDQASNERQIDHLFHHYKPQLAYKPIPSYLVGWDFPLNPCQEFGYLQGVVATGSGGANSAYYLADQTILFQAVNANFSMTQGGDGFNITAVAPSTFALIQYLEGQQVNEILSQRLSVALKGKVTTPSVIGTVNIYWTAAGSLANLPASVVTGVTNGTDAPTTAVGGAWNAVPRSDLGAARFTLTTTNEEFQLNGWDARAVAGIENATFIAVVISFNTIAAAQTVSLNYCSLNGGDIATRPAPQSFDQVLSQCQYYFEKSKNATEAVLSGSNNNAQVVQLSGQMTVYVTGSNSMTTTLHNSSFGVRYQKKRTIAPSVILYSGATPNVVAASGFENGGAIGLTPASPLPISLWTSTNLGDRAVEYIVTSPNSALYTNTQNPVATPSYIEGYLSFNYIVNARLGEVA